MKRLKEFLHRFILDMLKYMFKLIWAIPTAYMVGYTCDNLFDTTMLDNFTVLYLTLILTIPMLKVQFTSYKSEKGEQ